MLPSVPMEANHFAPFKSMGEMFAHVSTLFKTVGFENTPHVAENGGRGRGSPRKPSIDFMSAVSSPQTNAPAPRRISISKSNPLPRIFLPRSPYSRACFMAISSLSTAMGYSARTYMKPWCAPTQ